MDAMDVVDMAEVPEVEELPENLPPELKELLGESRF